MAIPKKVAERLIQILKSMTPIIEQQRSRDVSEADTSTLVNTDAFVMPQDSRSLY